MIANKKMIDLYKVIYNYIKAPVLYIIEDPYKENQDGICSYYERCNEIYDELCKGKGYRKLNDSDSNTRQCINFISYLINRGIKFKKDSLRFQMFFLEDKKNKDIIPAITVFGMRSGLIGTYIMYRHNSGELYCRPILVSSTNRKLFDRLDKFIFN